MLFQHDPAEPVGTWLEMRENERGLYVRGRLDKNVQRGRELISLLECGGLDGLSIGFRTVNATRQKFTNTRQLLHLDLWEVSLVTFPMLEGARVSDMKLQALIAATQTFPTANPTQGASTDMDVNTGLETKVITGDADGRFPRRLRGLQGRQ